MRVYNLEGLYIEKIAQRLFFTLHCTTMIESFQMQASVDKKENEEVGKRAIEFRCLLGAFFEVNKNFAGMTVKREAEDVCWLVFFAAFSVEFL